MSDAVERVGTEASLVVPADLLGCVLLWGASGSGKSGFLGGLYQLGRDKEGGNSGHEATWLFPWALNTGAGWVLEAWEELRLRQVRKTPPSHAEGTYESRQVILVKRTPHGTESARLSLALVDPPGEDVTERRRRDYTVVRQLRAAVASARAIIWLVPARGGSPHPSDEDRMWVLHSLTAILHEAGVERLEGVPLALCLSKIDLLTPERREAARRDPYAALKEHVGERTLRWLEAAFPTMETFAISAAGVLTANEKAASAGSPDGVPPGGAPIRPIDLSRVIEWVYKKSEETRVAPPREPGWEPVRERLRGIASRVRGSGRGFHIGLGALAVMAGTASAVVVLDRLQVPAGSEIAAPGPPAGTQPILPPRPGTTITEPPEVTSALAQARNAAQRGDWPVVLNLLSDTLPRESPSARIWDSLSATAAMREARRLTAARGGGDLYALARARAARVIDFAPPASSAAAPFRLVRAQACIEGNLGCPDREIREDLTIGALTPNTSLRARFQELRSRWRGG